MAYIEWQDFMAIGVPLVDYDHRLMVALVNQVQACIGGKDEAATLGSVLKALDDYTDFHFQREEKLQEHLGYPGLAAHRVEHARLTAQVRDVIRRVQAAPGSVRAADLQDFLEAWLMDHILNEDKAFQPYAQGKVGAEQAALSVAVGQQRGRQPAHRTDWSRLSVLVIDDNPNFLTLMDTILTGFGVGRVEAAGSLDEGRDLLDRRPFDAVVVNSDLDGLDSQGLSGDIRRSPNKVKAKTCILMLGGKGDQAGRDKAVAAGVDAFLDKPVSPRELLMTLAGIIEARRR
jgi:hemerythrin-like metal-binding protein